MAAILPRWLEYLPCRGELPAGRLARGAFHAALEPSRPSPPAAGIAEEMGANVLPRLVRFAASGRFRSAAPGQEARHQQADCAYDQAQEAQPALPSVCPALARTKMRGKNSPRAARRPS